MTDLANVIDVRLILNDDSARGIAPLPKQASTFTDRSQVGVILFPPTPSSAQQQGRWLSIGDSFVIEELTQTIASQYPDSLAWTALFSWVVGFAGILFGGYALFTENLYWGIASLGALSLFAGLFYYVLKHAEDIKSGGKR